jgi:hypothetical protein
MLSQRDYAAAGGRIRPGMKLALICSIAVRTLLDHVPQLFDLFSRLNSPRSLIEGDPR